MYDVFKVLNWLRVRNYTDLQKHDPNAEELTQLKAMKLLYYIQAATLSITGHRLFPENIVAWKYGPAVVEVHDRYIHCRGIVNNDQPITADDQLDYQELQNDPKVSYILDGVYNLYGYTSAYDLMKQTHKEDPWIETPQSHVITDDLMINFFSGAFDKKEINEVDMDTINRLFDENKNVMDWLKDK